MNKHIAMFFGLVAAVNAVGEGLDTNDLFALAEKTTGIRYWSGAQSGMTLPSPLAWDPFGAPAAGDTLYINSTAPAALVAGESVSVTRMFVGSGSRWNESTQSVDLNSAYDLGARLDVTGGNLTVADRLDVGGGHADNSNAVMTVSGGASVFVGGLYMGDCASNNGKSNALTISNATFTIGGTGESRIANYNGGTAFINVLKDGSFMSKSTLFFGSGDAKMTIDGGQAEFQANETLIGTSSANRSGTVEVKAGELLTKTLQIGRDNGNGVLALSGGHTVVSNAAWYGTFNLGWAGSGKLKMSDDADLKVYDGPLAVARTSSGKGVVEMTGGTIDVVNNSVTIGFERNGDTGDMSEGSWTMTGGSVVANEINVGGGGLGEMLVAGGTVTSRGWFWIGRNTYAEGKLKVSNAELTSTYGVVVGSSGSGELELLNGNYANLQNIYVPYDPGVGVLKVGEGATLSGSYIELGRASGGRGMLEVNGGEIDSTHNFTMANAEGSVCSMTVNGGRAKFGDDFYVSQKGLGTLTMNGGELLCTYWLDLVRSQESTETGCALNLNGGELKVGKVHTYVDATINWNGGVFKPNNSFEYVFGTDNGATMTINVLKGGAIFDSTTRLRSIDQKLTGVGAFTLRGEQTVYVKKPWNLKGGFIVEGGSLVLEQQIDSATGVMKQIEVAEGASLDLRGAEVTVLSYCVAGVEKESGTYAECNGTIHVLGGIAPATATWTNAAGDNDTANSDNWLVKNASGEEIINALPTNDTVVTVPYGGTLADWSAVPAKSLVVAFEGAQKLHSPVNVPEVISSALAWYDLADTSSVTAEDGLLTGIKNKGTGGAGLDGIVDGNKKPAYGFDTLNGLNVMSMTNTHGFISKEASGISGEQDRTLLVLTRQYKDQYYDGENYYNQNFPIGIETGGDYGTFRIEWGSSWQRYFYNAKTLSMPGQSDWNEWAILSIDSKESVVAGTRWTASEGLVNSTGGGTQTNLETSASAKISVGYRRQFASPSSGAVAEAVVIAKKLTDEEMTACRNYLRTKWFDYVNPSDLPTDIALVSDAELDLNGQDLSLASISGSGTLTNGKVESIGTLTATIKENGTTDLVTIDGDFNFANLGAVVVTGSRNLGKDAVALLKVNGTLSGEFDSAKLSIDGESARFKTFVQDGKLMLLRRNGLVVIIK